MALQITPEGIETEIQPLNRKYFNLKELYVHTNCDCIDIVGLSDGRQMVVDDNGLCVNEPKINAKATALYQQGRDTDAPIAGTVLVCSKGEVR